MKTKKDISTRFLEFMQYYKYEILLLGLIQHLFSALFLKNLDFYAKVVWPINMIVLGIASMGMFREKSKNEILVKNILLFFVILLPILAAQYPESPMLLKVISIVYALFFGYLFVEVFRFLIKPFEFNTDVLSASGCGYLLLIEIFAFLLQYMVYVNPNCLKNVNLNSPQETFIDLVYFITITITTIGYGDISPNIYYTKLFASLMGLIGQFYTVVLTGILVSNFAPSLIRKNKN